MTTRCLAVIGALMVGAACSGPAADSTGTAASDAPPSRPARQAASRPEGPAAAEERGLLQRLLGSRPQYREVTIPEGTVLRVALATPLSSATSLVEDLVRGTLREPLAVDGVEAVSAGATVEGSVVHVERSGRVKGLAELAFRFHAITTADGTTHRIETSRLAYEAQATKKEDAATIGIGAGAGAVAGAIAGGRRGAAIGSGLGAAAGTGVVLATRGEEVTIAAGTVVTARLTAPLTVRVRVD